MRQGPTRARRLSLLERLVAVRRSALLHHRATTTTLLRERERERERERLLFLSRARRREDRNVKRLWCVYTDVSAES